MHSYLLIFFFFFRDYIVHWTEIAVVVAAISLCSTPLCKYLFCYFRWCQRGKFDQALITAFFQMNNNNETRDFLSKLSELSPFQKNNWGDVYKLCRQRVGACCFDKTLIGFLNGKLKNNHPKIFLKFMEICLARLNLGISSAHNLLSIFNHNN